MHDGYHNRQIIFVFWRNQRCHLMFNSTKVFHVDENREEVMPRALRLKSDGGIAFGNLYAVYSLLGLSSRRSDIDILDV